MHTQHQHTLTHPPTHPTPHTTSLMYVGTYPQTSGHAQTDMHMHAHLPYPCTPLHPALDTTK